MKSLKATNSVSVRLVSGCIHHLFDAGNIEIGSVQIHDESGCVQLTQRRLRLLNDFECLRLLKDYTGLVSTKPETFEACYLIGKRDSRDDEPVFGRCFPHGMVAGGYFAEQRRQLPFVHEP